jgi:hypothetical protein
MIIVENGIPCGGPTAPRARLAREDALDLLIDGVLFVAGDHLRNNTKYVALSRESPARQVVAEIRDGALWFVATNNWP